MHKTFQQSHDKHNWPYYGGIVWIVDKGSLWLDYQKKKKKKSKNWVGFKSILIRDV